MNRRRPAPRLLAGLFALLLAVGAGIVWATRDGASQPATPPKQSAVTAFRGVTVIPMDSERLLTDHTVVVENGRIVALGPTAGTTVPAGATVVEGAGKFLIPGLAEMHAHIPTSDQGMEAVDRTLFLYLAGGVTTIRGMLAPLYNTALLITPIAMGWVFDETGSYQLTLYIGAVLMLLSAITFALLRPSKRPAAAAAR